MTYRCTFRNGESRCGLSLEEAWTLFWAYHLTQNPCSLSVES